MKQIAYNFPNIKFVVGSKDLVEKIATIGKISSSNIFALPSNKWFELGALQVKLESVTHDVTNHLCKFKIGNKKGIYIVDTSNVDNIIAKDYTLYLIEANYDEKLLEKHIQEIDDKDKLYYLDRVKRTHLSKQQAYNFLISNQNWYSEFEFIHKSSYNFVGE